MIRPEILRKAKKNLQLKIAIMTLKQVSQYTVEEWFKKNASVLTETAMVDLFSKHLNEEREAITTLPEYQEQP